MKKIFTIFTAVLMLVYTTGILFAADGDFKNNLLKLELTETNNGGYNINIYTQKLYTEPVKVVKKTDTVYYFLLPETKNSITSVTPTGAIKNVLIKTYPYAGQDEKNGYTKVAIITSKPINFTTSTKAADTSISPKLDPIRLARLDQVFERYSEKLAANNIPTPLAEFRKTKIAQTSQTQPQRPAQTTPKKVPTAKKTTAITQSKQKIATANTQSQSKKAKTQSAQKPISNVQKAKKTTAITQKPTQTVSKAKQVQIAQKPPISIKKPAVQPKVQKKPTQTAQKPAASIQKPTIQPKVQTNVKTTAAQKPSIQIKPIDTTPKAGERIAQTVKTATKPFPEPQASTTKSPVTKKVQNTPVKQQKEIAEQKTQNVPVKQNTAAPKTVKLKPIKETTAKETKQATNPIIPFVESTKLKLSKLTGQTQKQTPKTEQPNTTSTPIAQKPKQTSSTPSPKINDEVKKYEKELASKQPVDVLFQEDKKSDNIEDAKNITPEIPEKQVQAQNEQQENGITPEEKEQQKNLNILILIGTFVTLAYAYIQLKKQGKFKAVASSKFNRHKEIPNDVKEMFKNRGIKIPEQENIQQPDKEVETVPAQPVYNEEMAPVVNQEQEVAENVEVNVNQETEAVQPVYNEEINEEVNEEEASEASYNAEDLNAFNRRMDELQSETNKMAEKKESQRNDFQEEEEEEEYNQILQELYTPIDSTYSDENVVAQYSDETQNNEDFATIVSSSKLTETRGLYLAKFEGTTSLVGYIQDDIYVLYNFGNMEVKDTDIESRLAKESATDSLYIVKTGGKQLVVKSTPYEMSLEGVMK